MISIIIPSRNGAETLPALCEAVDRCLLDGGWAERELIVVLDASEDRSAELLEPLLAAGTVRRLIALRERAGQQQATLCGLMACGGAVILTMDDDFQHHPADIGLLLASREKGNDLVFGVVLPTRQSGVRKGGGRLRTGLFRLAAGCGPGVIPSSFRLFSRSCAAELLKDPSQFCYLSVHLARGARKTASVLLNRSTHKGPGRHRFRSLVSSLLMLGFCLPPVPAFFRRLAGGVKWKSRTILVVGGGKGQLGLVHRCREKGLRVAVSDRDPDAPALPLADYFLKADTFDPAGSVMAVKTAAGRGIRIDGAATAGTDQPVLTVARIADAFSLPGALPPDTALAVTNKRVMKQRLTALGLPVLPWQLIGEADRGGMGTVPPDAFFPAVLKPVDSQGQRGIFLVKSREELFRYLPRTLACSREERAMVEPCYPSGEVTFSGWVHRGILYPLLLTDRATMQSGVHIGICPAHRYPSRYLASHGEAVTGICSDFVSGFGIREGAVYVQLLVGEAGLVINEVACRIGGAYEEVLIPRLAGVKLLDLQIELALEGTLSPGSIASLEKAADAWPPEGFASVILAFAREGKIAECGRREDLCGIPGVIAADYLLNAGAEPGKIENSTGRAAWAVIAGSGREEVNSSVHRLYDTLELISDTGENLLMDLRESALHLPKDTV
jgi:phosphoribosylaminoimidazole carboxylase (NCAIR synthetase)